MITAIVLLITLLVSPQFAPSFNRYDPARIDIVIEACMREGRTRFQSMCRKRKSYSLNARLVPAWPAEAGYLSLIRFLPISSIQILGTDGS